MGIALTFPGQGSQKIGMGEELAEAFPAAREVFQEVDDALKQNLSKLMWHGEESDLTLTENAQPALMAVSLAVMKVLETELALNLSGSVKFVAGHSLGEYSALAASGAISLSDTARLLKIRGQAMQRAVPVGAGAMAAVLGLDLKAVNAVLAELESGAICQTANDNAPGQIVISGDADAVERAIDLAREAGAKRAIALPVSAPFHCALMQPAADAMAEALDGVKISTPVVPVISNVTAGPIERPDDIKTRLIEQVTGMVRWRESVLYMAKNDISDLFEIGAGKVLSGLARRIDRDLTAHAIGAPADFDAHAGTFQ